MQNQMNKKIDSKVETGVIYGLRDLQEIKQGINQG